MNPKKYLTACVCLLASWLPSQTPYANGQPGLAGSDQRHNGQGTLSPGSITVLTDAGGSIETWSVGGAPGHRLIMASSPAGAPPMVLTAASQLDLNLASMAILMDGVTFTASPFDAFAFIPPSGLFSIALSASLPAGPIASYQFAVVGATLPFGYRTTQRIDLVAGSTCTGGTNLILSDDSFLNVAFSPGTFAFYGTSFTSVFVNSNGSLTFNNGDINFTPTVVNFLGDFEPRISPLWTDLSPNLGGTVTARQQGSLWRCCFRGVPHYGTTPLDSNNFTVNLMLNTGQISFEYGGCTVGGSTAVIAGISAGSSFNVGGVSSNLGGGLIAPGGLRDAIYENFAAQAFSPGFDLSFTTISFNPTGGNGVGPYVKP